MHYDYVVTLKRENARKTDLVSFILLIFSLLAFCYAQIHYGIHFFLLVASAILLTGLVINLNILRRGKEMRFRLWLFAAGIFWLGMPFLQWMFLPYVFFALMEAQAKYPLEIGFDAQGIVINALFKKKYPWTSLQSVILKDGLLTLDFKDNKLIQKEVLDDEDPDATVDEFNDYCQGKLLILH